MEHRRAKLSLSFLIEKEIERQFLTEETACSLLCITYKDLRDIYEGNIDSFTIFELLRYLNYLGRDVILSIFPSKDGTSGEIFIKHMDNLDDDSDKFLSDGGMKVIYESSHE